MSLLLLPILALNGCGEKVLVAQQTLELMHSRGDYALASQFLDEPQTIKTYEADRPGGKDAVLWQLERGSAALASDDPQRAIDVLNRAEERTRYNYERRPADILATWVFNDTAPEFLAAAYEDQYINVFKTLAYLELGQIDGKATAEARRLSDKARYLRSVFGRYYHALSAESESRYAAAERGMRIDDDRLRRYAVSDPSMEFVESPLGAYLSAIAFLKTPGESEARRGAALRLLDCIRQEGPIVGNVDPAPFLPLADGSMGPVNTLVVAFAGMGPTRTKEEFGPVFLWYTSVHIVLPRLVAHPSEVTGASLETSDGGRFDLHLVEDMSRVAQENFERQMPEIYQRTMVRVIAKAVAVGAATVATDEAEHNHHDSGAAAAEIAVRALGFLYMWLSEDADTRCWTMLPGAAYVAHLNLPPGEHNVRVVYTTRSGSTITQPWRRVDIPADADSLTTVVEHRPD